MYNGIGLRTPRGSGTNGYVIRNSSFVKPLAPGSNRKPTGADVGRATARRPSRNVLLHKERRQVEIDLLKLREELEEEAGMNGEQVELRICKERTRRYAEVERMLDRDLKVEKEREMDKVAMAFEISSEYREGDAFRFADKKPRPPVEQIKYD